MSAEADKPVVPETDSLLARAVALTSVALVVARLIALVAGIATVSLASRYLGLRNFGALTVGMAFASLFAVLTDLGLSTVATREIAREPANERQVLGNVVVIGLLGAAVAAALGLGLMELVYGGAQNEPTRQAIVVLLVQVFAAPITGAARAFFTVRQRGYLIASGDLALALGMAIFTGIVVAGHLGYRAVVIGVASAYVLQAIVMATVAVSIGVRLRYDHRTGLRLVLTALPLAGVLVLNYLYFRLDVLLLSWFKTNVEVARYGLAYRVIEGLMVLPSYVMLTLFPVIARSEHDRARLAAMIGAALGGLEAIALPVTALLAIFSPEVVVLLGGHKYAATAPVLAILSLALGLSYLSGVFGNALMALGRQRTVFWLGMGPLALNLVANLILIPPLAAVGAAISVVISEAAALALAGAYYVHVAGPPVQPPHLRILAAGIPLAVLAAVKFALPLGSEPLLVVGVGGLLGMLVYAALVLCLGILPASISNRLPLPDRLLGTPPAT